MLWRTASGRQRPALCLSNPCAHLFLIDNAKVRIIFETTKYFVNYFHISVKIFPKPPFWAICIYYVAFQVICDDSFLCFLWFLCDLCKSYVMTISFISAGLLKSAFSAFSARKYRAIKNLCYLCHLCDKIFCERSRNLREPDP